MKSIQEILTFSEEETNALKQNWIKCLNDPIFNHLVAKLSLPDEILMKYTSSLEDAAAELEHCRHCSNLEMCKNKLQGYLYTPLERGNGLTFQYQACPYQEKKLHDNAYKNNILLFEIPKMIKEASFRKVEKDDKNRLEVIKYFKEFLDHYEDEEKPRGIYLYGSFGTGKSYLIAALFNELAKRGVHSAMIYVPEFLRILKSSFDHDFEEKYEYIKKVPLLLLDDIGAENLTAWARDEIIGTLLQYRMDEKLPTFFTSNLDLKQLEEHFSTTNSGVDKLKARRIIERIRFLTKDFCLTSRNRRQ